MTNETVNYNEISNEFEAMLCRSDAEYLKGGQAIGGYRKINMAVSLSIEEVVRRLIDAQFRPHRSSPNRICLRNASFTARIEISDQKRYLTLVGGISAATPEDAASTQRDLQGLFKDSLITAPMFEVEWFFKTGQKQMYSRTIDQMADDVLHDACYPFIKGGVRAFARNYFAAEEPILILQGDPGTGKTRFTRFLMGELARGRDEKPNILYANDEALFHNDELFVRFLTDETCMLVVEDADHLLRPRSDGNANLHFFLKAADGIVRAEGRKIVFTTNLPNIRDIDQALARPGRCFDRLMFRAFESREASAAARAIYGVDVVFEKKVVLADVYHWGRTNNLAAAKEAA